MADTDESKAVDQMRTKRKKRRGDAVTRLWAKPAARRKAQREKDRKTEEKQLIESGDWKRQEEDAVTAPDFCRGCYKKAAVAREFFHGVDTAGFNAGKPLYTCAKCYPRFEGYMMGQTINHYRRLGEDDAWHKRTE